MDFSNRGVAPQPQQQTPHMGMNPQTGGKKGMRNKKSLTTWGTVLMGTLVFLLIVAVILVVGFARPNAEDSYVYSNKLQAVFLNTGQVYFGNIKSINPEYMVLDNIFYLQTNNGSGSSSSSSNQNVSLVKLGCELHAPYDQMVINSSQVTFWENLQSSGQVAKAVAKYHQQYPKGQTCSSQNSSAAASSPSTSNGSSITPATSSSTVKKP
jgi:hypothetical protein